MPESFDIRSSTGNYKVTIGSALTQSLLKRYEDAVLIVDERLATRIHADSSRVITIEATEEKKSMECMPHFIAQMRNLGVHRRTHMIAIGGGVIQDIATFLASIYMRGIAWTYLPTTLLGMVDSCVGGKSSINVGGYKNLVGNFYPPQEIMINLDFLESLGQEPIVAGLCEAAKICYAKSFDQFESYWADMQSGQGLSKIVAEKIIARSLHAKQWFIEIDEFDQKERLLLNFGHTFGHALEAASDFGISHGVAVGVGILVAEEYARSQLLLSNMGSTHISALSNHLNILLQEVPTLAGELKRLDLSVVMKKFDSDKKHLADHYRVVVPCGDGELELIKISRTNDSRAKIIAAYQQAVSRI